MKSDLCLLVIPQSSFASSEFAHYLCSHHRNCTKTSVLRIFFHPFLPLCPRSTVLVTIYSSAILLQMLYQTSARVLLVAQTRSFHLCYFDGLNAAHGDTYKSSYLLIISQGSMPPLLPFLTSQSTSPAIELGFRSCEQSWLSRLRCEETGDDAPYENLCFSQNYYHINIMNFF